MPIEADVENCVNKLAAAARTLASNEQRDGTPSCSFSGSTDIPVDASSRLETQRSLATCVSEIQMLLSQPADFLRRLALHTQLLACLHWLCEFQVLACIPLEGSVSFGDVADIIGVPEDHLRRVSRFMATAVGFLKEPQPDHVAHSSLSAQFVTQPALLDAAMFLSETAAPTALKMPLATRLFAATDLPEQSAYTSAFGSPRPLARTFELQPKLQRQFATYLLYSTLDETRGVQDVLMRVDWVGLGKATVVEVGAKPRMVMSAVVASIPNLHCFVQEYETDPLSPAFAEPHASSIDLVQLNSHFITTPPPPIHGGIEQQLGQFTSNVTVQRRYAGTPQMVQNAAIYVLHLPSPSPSLPWSSIAAHTASELRAHVDVLRRQPTSRLLITALVLPSPATVDITAETAVRLRDISLLQLASGRQAERKDIVNLLNGTSDRSGGLVLTNEVQSATSPFVAFEARYQVYNEMNA